MPEITQLQIALKSLFIAITLRLTCCMVIIIHKYSYKLPCRIDN